jgi:hypothetical protein
LTFAPPYTTDKQNYQGVYFKWGSLVGISPVTASPFTARVVYAPNGSGGWEDPATFHYSAITGIPAIDVPTETGSQYMGNIAWLSSDENNTSAITGQLKGDICRYLSETDPTITGTWRMPVSSEFLGYIQGGGNNDLYSWSSVNPGATPNFAGWVMIAPNFSAWPAISIPTTDDAKAGRYDGLIHGGKYVGNTFPASGAISGVEANGGNYWTSAARGHNQVFVVTISTSGIGDTNLVMSNASGLSVRCVRVS